MFFFLPLPRASVARVGLGLSGGRWAVRSCVFTRFLRALDLLSGGFRPVSGSFWMNFFSTYLDFIQDSLSPLRDGGTTHQIRSDRIRQRSVCSLLTAAEPHNEENNRSRHAELCRSLCFWLHLLGQLCNMNTPQTHVSQSLDVFNYKQTVQTRTQCPELSAA